MKISFNSTIFSQEKAGGISRYFICLIKKLIENNIDIKVTSILHKNIFLKTLSKKHSSGFYLSNYPLFKWVENLNNSKFNKYNLTNQTDIIHDTYYTFGVKKLKKMKKIITVHDLIHEKFRDFYRNSQYLINLKKKSFEDCDHFICVSQNTKKDLIENYNIDKDRISVIYHGADHLIKKKASMNFKIDYPFILFVGNREKYKNFEFLLKAYSKSKKISSNFNLVCFGGGKFSKKENELIDKFYITKKIIHVTGDDQLLCNYYSNAKALIIPSIYEGFGLTLIEAMRFKCPIFCSNIDVFKEISDDHVINFDPRNELNLISQLEDNLFNENKLNEISLKAFKNSENFTWEKSALNTIKVYNKLI